MLAISVRQVPCLVATSAARACRNEPTPGEKIAVPLMLVCRTAAPRLASCYFSFLKIGISICADF